MTLDSAKQLMRRNSNALLLLVCLGQFMVILDVSIVNVALPSIKHSLGFSTTGLQWVLNAYTLTFASFLLLGGRASDLFGRRRMFLAGTLLFSGASLLCAVAMSPALLLAARALQGIAGAVLVTLGMTGLPYGIVTTDRLSWGSPGVLAPLAAGVALLVAFTLYERGVAREPLMPLRVFRLRTLRAANVVIFLLYAAILGFWFFQPLYMQGTLHYSALTTGVAFVPMTLGVAAGPTLAPRPPRRMGAPLVLAAGMLFAFAGEALLTGVHPGGTYLAQVLPGGMLGAFGLGLSLVPATIIAVQGVPAANSGLASGVLNTSRFIGAALGLAVLSTIAASHTHSEAASGTSP